MKKFTVSLLMISMLILSNGFCLDVKEGKHFQKITEPCDETDKCAKVINVSEYFTYICPGCYKLEPKLEKWLTSKPEDVNFTKVPIAFSSKKLKNQAKGYYIAKHYGKDIEYSKMMFNNIQNKHIAMDSEDEIMALLVSLGIEQTNVEDGMKSFALDLQLRHDEEKIIKRKIFEMPTFMVNYAYKANPQTAGGYDKVFKVIDHLLEMTRNKTKNEIIDNG